MIDDHQLLEQFVCEQSESAFGELVRRHIDLVYAVALRLVNGDVHLAQDVTQSVLIDLARKAGSLPSGAVLPGWLHRHACFTASNAIRKERRLKTREQTAMELQALDDSSEPPWTQIAPLVDDGLNQLNNDDRHALVLRFLKQQDFRSVGAALGVNEDTAQKRVSRALDKLRGLLAGRGVVLSATALGSMLAAQTIKAAPAGLANGIISASLAASAKSGAGFAVLKFMASTKLQTSAAIAIIIASVATPVVLQQKAAAALGAQTELLRQQTGRIAELTQEQQQLSNSLAAATSGAALAASNAHMNELLRLRGEVSLLTGQLQTLRATGTNQPFTRAEVLDSMRQACADRIDRVKQLFAANPAVAVPELPYLTDRAWLDVLQSDRSHYDPDNRKTLSSVRNMAQLDFATSYLWEALRKYGREHSGQFPTDVSQLAPYFKIPVDDATLADWTIVPTASLSEKLQVDEPLVITQKAPIDIENDQRIVVGLKSTQSGMPSRDLWSATAQTK